ncbi:hypothetical protein OAE11_00800 [Akkermansiaceae bacterium]|nr:hypothetical protein [Akkermansiaceae bacterium]MDB4271503.1 hypothetical protein [Akkermansiaceae bacterium]MDB4283242.1 hypothetical protein [Akkermansiaceae bacterium]MDB4294600.1 hypothetical protein [Akkermansiaceae bacterium]MDB4332632.1 hypothetical protein [Akkermansiaceae bacterium]
MKRLTPKSRALTGGILLLSISLMTPALAQLVDETQVTPTVPSGTIGKSLDEQVGAGRGDSVTPQSSIYLIQRDPARSIRRGRQLFQRKFTSAQGLGPRVNPHSSGNIMLNPAFGAGLSESCAACHGRPRGSAGFGGVVATRPDSRDSPHLFGLGLQEMIADEMTQDLRSLVNEALLKRAAEDSADGEVPEKVGFKKRKSQSAQRDRGGGSSHGHNRGGSNRGKPGAKPTDPEEEEQGEAGENVVVRLRSKGVDSTSPYGHDGRSINFEEVILRHGGEAERSKKMFEKLREEDKSAVIAFLRSLVLFPPDDTASNLNPGDPDGNPQDPADHGSINLGVLFQIPDPDGLGE